MASRAGDWMRQAERDLDHARRSGEMGDHEWACFAAQQASEKALKAVVRHAGGDARGPLVRALLEAILEREGAPDEATALRSAARELDQHYVPT